MDQSSTEQARESSELRESFRAKFGFRPFLTYRMCMNGENFEQALREAIRTGNKGNIRNADWRARMSDDGPSVDLASWREGVVPIILRGSDRVPKTRFELRALPPTEPRCRNAPNPSNVRWESFLSLADLVSLAQHRSAHFLRA